MSMKLYNLKANGKTVGSITATGSGFDLRMEGIEEENFSSLNAAICFSALLYHYNGKEKVVLEIDS